MLASPPWIQNVGATCLLGQMLVELPDKTCSVLFWNVGLGNEKQIHLMEKEVTLQFLMYN